MPATWLRRPLLVVTPAAVVLVLLGGWLALRAFDTERTAIPVPLPVYEIEATSGGHNASLLNLRLGQPGALQAPVPVDVDGDLIRTSPSR